MNRNKKAPRFHERRGHRKNDRGGTLHRIAAADTAAGRTRRHPDRSGPYGAEAMTWRSMPA